MSGFGHPETGEKKIEAAAHHVLQQNPILTHPARFTGILSPNLHVQHDILKTALPAGVKHVSTRPIAPAPGMTVATAVSVSTAKLLSAQAQHAMMTKPTGLGLEAMNLHGQQHQTVSATQTVAVNLSTQSIPSNVTSNQGLHITMSSQPLHSIGLQNNMASLGHGGTILQSQQYTQMPTTEELLAKARQHSQEKEKSRITVMAPGGGTDHDRARATIPMASLIRSGTLPQGLQQSPAQVNLTLTPGMNQGHVTPTQTPIIHALQPSHIPRGPAAASALAQKIGSIANPIMRPSQASSAHLQSPLLQHNVPMRAPLRPTLPTSQVVTTATSAHQQAEIQRASAHIMTSLPGSPAVQISALQGRPVLSHIQSTKGAISSTQPIMQQGYTAQGQKVVVSQSPLLSGATSGATLVSVATPKLTGQSLALNLAHPPGGATRTQKILTTQVPSLASAQGTLGGQTLSLGPGIPRGQKVLVSQSSLPAGAVVVNTAAKQGVASINLGQRPQKVIMSHVAVSTAMSHVAVSSMPVSMATIPKTGVHPTMAAHGMTAPTMVSTTTMTTQPISKKVKMQAPRPAQPHVAMTTSQHLTQDHPTAHREVAAPGHIRPTMAQSLGHMTQAHLHQQGQIQGGLFGIPGPRPMAINQVTHVQSSGATSGQVTTQTDLRTQSQDRAAVRPGFQSHLPFPIQEYSNINPANYYNLVYQPNPSVFPAGSAIRPNLVSGQPVNLAATLQTTPQAAISTATGIQAGVRINPPSVMVNVDPSHANTIAMVTQFAGAGTVEAAHPTTVVAPITQSIPVTHPVGGGTSPMPHGNNPANQQQGGGANQTTNASPRPSILRKRPHDTGVMIVKRNLLSSVNAVDSPTQPDLNNSVLSPKGPVDPSIENSQSSTDTASSSESTPQSNSEVKVKQEPLDAGEQDATTGLMLFGQIANNNIEASPRKKPRKQLLEANNEMQDDYSSDEELDKLAKEDIKKELEWMEEDLKKEEEAKAALAAEVEEMVDEDGVRWTRERRRPPVNLLNHYSCNWKSRNNHFNRYNDVKSKEERRPTVNELANQKGIHQKASGWKMYHLAAQLEELMDMERDVFSSMTLVQDCIAPKHIAKNPTMEDDISMVHELTQGNIQRCQLVMDQLEEARVSMVKVLDHKKRIGDVINKHHSKRPVKKKERT